MRTDEPTAVLSVVPPASAELAPRSRQAPDRDPLRVYLKRVGERSRRVMGVALERQARLLTGGRYGAAEIDWSQVGYQHTAALRAELQEAWIDEQGEEHTLTPATVNLYLAALRGILKECWRLGYTDADRYRRTIDIEPVRGEAAPRGRALDADEVRALFATCARDPDVAGRRDAALIAVLYGAGLRRSEASALDVRDYTPTTGAPRVRHGKGNKAPWSISPEQEPRPWTIGSPCAVLSLVRSSCAWTTRGISCGHAL